MQSRVRAAYLKEDAWRNLCQSDFCQFTFEGVWRELTKIPYAGISKNPKSARGLLSVQYFFCAPGYFWHLFIFVSCQ
jgi:hypothetical protein